MNLPALAIRRPVGTVMIVLLVVFLGVIAVLGTPTDLLPEMSLPIIAVVTQYPGAGSQEVEYLVTRPIERVLSYVAGVERITSESSEGASTVIAEFSWGAKIDLAVLDVRDGIDTVKAYLPDDASAPRIVKADPSMMPLMRLALSGPYRLAELTRTADELRNRLERIEGVASVGVGGGIREEVWVEFDPVRLNAYGLSITQIASTLRVENLSLPGGQLDEAQRRLNLRTEGQFTSLADISKVQLSSPLGIPVGVGELGTVKLVETPRSSYNRVNMEPAVTISVRKQSGTNSVMVARQVQRVLREVSSGLPDGVVVHVVQDQSAFINRAVAMVTQNILLGGLLAVVVLYLFLVELRSVAVIGMAIPVSLMGAFSFMYFSGLTLNLVSLGGLALGVGMLVDNAIVILENIFRHHEAGLDPSTAAVSGTQEVAAAVTASTLTTVVVFLPVVFVEGLASQIFRELALTVSFALASSLVVAMTFVPMMTAVLLKTASRQRVSALQVRSRRAQDRLSAAYRRTLSLALGRRALALGGVFLLVLVTVVLVYRLPRQMFPKMDEREVTVEVRAARGSSLAHTDVVIREIERIALQRADMDFVFASTGGDTLSMTGGAEGTDVGTVTLRLLPRRRGMMTTAQVTADLRRQLAGVPGAEIMLTTRSGLAGEERMFGAPVSITVRGTDLGVLMDLSEQVRGVVATVPGVVNARSTLAAGSPEVQITVDRERAAQYGLGSAQIAISVKAAVAGQVATNYNDGRRTLDVRLMFQESNRSRLSDVEDMLLLSPTGRTARLSEVAAITVGTGPTTIYRRDQGRVAEVQAGLAGRDIDSAMRDVKALVAGLPLPPGYEIEYGGESSGIMDAFGSLGQAFLMAAVLVYMVMAVQFESARHPLVMMATLPLALAGAFLGLGIWREPLSIPALVGVIALGGVVVNNGIVLVDYTNQLRTRGLSVREALLDAGTVRLRPILMTSLTTIIGLVPMAFAGGAGSELQKGLAVPFLVGMILATFLTLLIVPVLYTLIGGRQGPAAPQSLISGPNSVTTVTGREGASVEV
jgi:HAE1 family hydrophobic/amphiphilic exporter-1